MDWYTLHINQLWNAHPWATFVVLVAALAAPPFAMFQLFRRARRETCAWPRRWRLAAQMPGWGLVVLGTYIVIGLAVMEIREKRVGLGTGTCVAVLSAVAKWLLGGTEGQQTDA